MSDVTAPQRSFSALPVGASAPHSMRQLYRLKIEALLHTYKNPRRQVRRSEQYPYISPSTYYPTENMALSGPGGIPINAEQADNFEDIEKQFAVKGRF